MTAPLWSAMVGSARRHVRPQDTLISGGAAWADHLPEHTVLEGGSAAPELSLPAPFEGRFIGPGGSSASAANYYHDRFSAVIGQDTLRQIGMAIDKGAVVHAQPAMAGYRGMFARNTLVARAADSALAYTFGDVVATDSGTGNTWKQIRGERTHVSLSRMAQSVRQSAEDAPSVRRFQVEGRL